MSRGLGDVYKRQVDSGNFDWTADPKRQPLFNEPDDSYNGAVWGKVVPELTGANIPFAVRARVCLLRDLGSACSPDNASVSYTHLTLPTTPYV